MDVLLLHARPVRAALLRQPDRICLRGGPSQEPPGPRLSGVEPLGRLSVHDFALLHDCEYDPEHILPAKNIALAKNYNPVLHQADSGPRAGDQRNGYCRRL